MAFYYGNPLIVLLVKYYFSLFVSPIHCSCLYWNLLYVYTVVSTKYARLT